MAPASLLFGGIEAGGTKFVCAVGDTPQTIHASTAIPTTTPAATVNQVIAFFRPYAVQCIGLATFGPIDLNRGSPTYGQILSTPKLAWQGYPILDILQTELGRPVAVDTDVNAAALAAITAILSPQRIIIGGGVMHQPHLLPRIREACAQTLHGYLPRLKTSSDFEAYIVAPALGDAAGVIGALYLAQEISCLSSRSAIITSPWGDFA